MAGFFSDIGSFFYTLWGSIVSVVTDFRLFDIADILIVAFIIFKGVELFRETRAQQLIKGIIILLLVWVLALLMELKTVQWLFVKLFDYALIAIAIVFQPELRRALERVGRSKLSRTIGLGASHGVNADMLEKCVEAVGGAARAMQEAKIGALIVFERETPLGEIINTGTPVDADTTELLLGSIFFPNSPMHDGAVVIRDGRVHSAGCILPLTQNSEMSANLGTRHRAAIGMSENSDAVVVVVSEETGTISIAQGGKLKRDFTPEQLTQTLRGALIVQQHARKSLTDLFKRGKKQEAAETDTQAPVPPDEEEDTSDGSE